MTSTHKQPLLLFAAICSLVLFLSYESSPTVAVAEVPQKVTTVQKVYTTPVMIEVSKGEYEYIEITNSCNFNFDGHCIPVYEEADIRSNQISDLRNGMVLKVKDKEVRNGQVWYRVHFDEWLRHPDRVEGDWYVPKVAGRIISADGQQVSNKETPKTSKRIVIDLSDHMIYAYEGNVEFLRTKVSTGIDATPTPVGTFTVYKKTPSRYMQGPIEGVTDVPFDLPGVPWNLYFTQDGAVIHGSYWHERYGTDQSNGCINLPPELAKLIYDWAPLGTTVTVQN